MVKAVALVFFLLGKWSEVKAAVRPETGGFFSEVYLGSRCFCHESLLTTLTFKLFFSAI